MANNTIFFSPLGVTDPIKFNYDGPMLHIIRNYKPDKVYLFFTKEIADIEESDQRYTKSINLMGYTGEIELIKTNIEDPSDFDAFMNRYPEILAKIRENNPDAEILVNVSSGTAQMISALCLEIASSKFIYTPIQVKTPKKESNIKPREFDIQKEIKELKDNKINSKRCNEPQILNFRKTIKKSELLSLIRKYDYNAAVEIFDETLFRNKNILDLLNHAKYRLNLQYDKAQEFINTTDIDLYFVENETINDFIEFFYVMKIKQLKGELSDFMLKITPLLASLMEYYLKQFMDINAIVEEKNKIRFFSRDKIKVFNQELLNHLDKRCKDSETKEGEFKNGFVSSFGLKHIIDFIPQMSNLNQKELQEKGFFKIKKLFGRLRDIEEKVRNTTAHEMISVTDDHIKEKSNYTSKEILTCFESLMELIFPAYFKKESLVYNDINNLIENNLD